MSEPPNEPAPPSEEELLAALKRIRVADVLVETMQSLASLGYHKLNPETRDLEQTRLAIEALKALNGVIGGSVPAALTRDLAQAVANLQLAYVAAVAEEGRSGEPAAPEAPAQPT